MPRPVRLPARLAAIAAIAAIVLSLAACGSDNGANHGTARPELRGVEITVGSGDGDQAILLAEIYGQALASRGATVVQTPNLGARSDYLPLLERGEVTVIPESTNALLTFLLDAVPPAAKNVSEQVDAIESALPTGLALLTPAAAEDKEAIVCRRHVAGEYDLATISQLGQASAEIVLGGPPDFRSGSPFGLDGLSDLLGAEFMAFEPLPSVTTILDALESGAIDCGVLRSTTISDRSSGLVTLEDDAAIVPNEAIVPLIAEGRATPEVQAVLDAVSSTLDTDGLAALVAQIRQDGADPAQVAGAWLAANGLS